MAFLFHFQMAQALQWLTNGNSATSADFIGTTNPTPLFFKIDNSLKMRLEKHSSGQGMLSIGVNTTGVLNVGLTNSDGTKVAIATGWGDWIQLKCSPSTGERRWAI